MDDSMQSAADIRAADMAHPIVAAPVTYPHWVRVIGHVVERAADRFIAMTGTHQLEIVIVLFVLLWIFAGVFKGMMTVWSANQVLQANDMDPMKHSIGLYITLGVLKRDVRKMIK
jgi:hypothetical protein